MIPVSVPSLTDLEMEYATDAISSTWISSQGPYLDRFEESFASDVSQTRDCLAVTNGTVALHLALVALGVGPGDEVIVPSLTYVATANAVKYVGAEPVFAEVEASTWCISPDSVERLIGPKTVGMIAVHLYGHPADMDRLDQLRTKHGLWLVEDAAEAPLAMYRGRPTGGLGDIATFSFYGNKIFSSGEGGAVTTNDSDLAERMRLLRGQGMDPDRRYYFPVVGYNFRMTNVAAAILVAQLERRLELVEARKVIFDRYDSALSGIDGIGRQPVSADVEIAPWLYCVTVRGELNERDRVAEELRAGGVDTRPFFIPIHTLPPYHGCRVDNLALTECLSAAGLNLPTFPDLTNEMVDQVAGALIEAVSHQER